jgi:hypothetical protein
MASITTNQQLPLFPKPTDIVSKVMHSGTDWVGQPYLYTDSSSVALRSQLGKGVLVDNVFGTTVTGPFSIFESLENMHINGGYWTINPMQLESIGSSSALPIPWLVPATPRILSSAQTISSSVSTLQSADPTITSVVSSVI